MGDDSGIGKIEKVKGADKNIIALIEQNLPPSQPTQPNEAYFKALMERVDKQETPKHRPEQTPHQIDDRDALADANNTLTDKRTSLINEINRISGKIKTLEFFKQPFQARIANVQTNADKAINKIEQIKGTLNDPSLKLKSSVSYLLQNRVNNVHNDLSTIYSKLGMEYEVPMPTSSQILAPVRKFFGYLADGQTQLEKLKQDVQGISKSNFSVADMLIIQIKVAHISQELEFFSNLLNKTLESTKSLMNVQV